MNKCINCGGQSVVGLFCHKCRRKIPSGFDRRQSPDIIMSEIRRNEALKKIFKADVKLGRLSVDTINRVFHVDNGYYRVSDLVAFNFYSSEPRFTYGFTRSKVWEDIYFAFVLNGVTPDFPRQERRVRRLCTVPCRYENTSRYIYIEPPLKMLNMKQLFAQMITDEKVRLMEILGGDASEVYKERLYDNFKEQDNM